MREGFVYSVGKMNGLFWVEEGRSHYPNSLRLYATTSSYVANILEDKPDGVLYPREYIHA